MKLDWKYVSLMDTWLSRRVAKLITSQSGGQEVEDAYRGFREGSPARLRYSFFGRRKTRIITEITLRGMSVI